MKLRMGWVVAALVSTVSVVHAQWPGLTDESTALQTNTYPFTGNNPNAGTTNENYYDGDMADFDGDGLADRMLGSRYGLMWNSGGGLMVPIRTKVNFLLRGDPGAGGWGEDAAQFADIDNDGDLDGLMGGNGEPLTAQRNQNGRFSVAWQLSRSALNISNTDVERDGDVDLIVAHSFCSNANCGGPVQFSLLINNGSGTYTEQSASRGFSLTNTDFIVGAVSGDIDGDGDFDILIQHGLAAGGQVDVAINDGTGHFTRTPTTLPVSCSGFGQAMNLGDMDGDGDLDLVIGRCGMIYAGGHAVVASTLALNDGTGVFTDVSATHFDTTLYAGTVLPSENAKVLDVDYDGDLDMLGFEKNNQTGVKHFSVFLNDGTGHLAYSATHSRNFMGNSSGLGADVDIADLDGDGVYDVWVGMSGDVVRILINQHQDPSGLPADRPRNVTATNGAGGVTVAWDHPPFAANVRHYQVYRAPVGNLEDRDHRLIKVVAASRHEDEGFAAPLTVSTTATQLGDPSVTLNGNRVSFVDATARANTAYVYTVSHVGTENARGSQTAEAFVTTPPLGGADTQGPAVDIVAPTTQEWSRFPRIVVHLADESGVDPASIVVRLDQALGGGARAANANLVDLAERNDGQVIIIPLLPPLSLPAGTLATLTVEARDVGNNQTTQTVAFFVDPITAGDMPPTAVASVMQDNAVTTPTVLANGAGSTAAAGDVVMRWEWYFGDGSTAFGRTARHTYAQAGMYTVMLVVRDNDGDVGVATQSVTVTGMAGGSSSSSSVGTGSSSVGGSSSVVAGSSSSVVAGSSSVPGASSSVAGISSSMVVASSSSAGGSSGMAGSSSAGGTSRASGSSAGMGSSNAGGSSGTVMASSGGAVSMAPPSSSSDGGDDRPGPCACARPERGVAWTGVVLLGVLLLRRRRGGQP